MPDNRTLAPLHPSLPALSGKRAADFLEKAIQNTKDAQLKAGLFEALEKNCRANPEFADKHLLCVVVNHILNLAGSISGDMWRHYNEHQEEAPIDRGAALSCLGAMVEHREDLAKEALKYAPAYLVVTKPEYEDDKLNLRKGFLWALPTIVEHHPHLVDNALVINTAILAIDKQYIYSKNWEAPHALKELIKAVGKREGREEENSQLDQALITAFVKRIGKTDYFSGEYWLDALEIVTPYRKEVAAAFVDRFIKIIENTKANRGATVSALSGLGHILKTHNDLATPEIAQTVQVVRGRAAHQKEHYMCYYELGGRWDESATGSGRAEFAAMANAADRVIETLAAMKTVAFAAQRPEQILQALTDALSVKAGAALPPAKELKRLGT